MPPLPRTEVGVVQSYRIPKATGAIPRSPRSIKDMDWVQWFLQDDDRFPVDEEVRDMAYLLQTVYEHSGMPVNASSLQPVPSVRPFLQDDSLVYIRLVSVHQAYEGQYLSKVLLDTYYHCLQRYPEYEFPSSRDSHHPDFAGKLISCVLVYACSDNTTLLLHPAHPGLPEGQIYDDAGQSPSEVIDQLIPFFQTLGFEVYRSDLYLDADTGGEHDDEVTAMGRRIPLEEW